MTVRNPPLERVFDVLDWLAQVLLKFTSLSSGVLRYRDVCKRCGVVDLVLIIDL
jgi:hypothetical protein